MHKPIEELIEALSNVAMPIEECKHIIDAHFREVLEAAADVADGSVNPGWLIAKDIRKLKEEL